MYYFMTRKSPGKPVLRIMTASVLSAVLLLTGCSGTGKMYRPEDDESSSYASSGSMETPEGAAEAATENSAETAEGRKTNPGDRPANPGDHPDEEIRKRSSVLEGTGSDLFTSETVDYYYSFTLEDNRFQLPCRFSDFSKAGWELVLPESEGSDSANLIVPYYSYEFFDLVQTGESTGSAASSQSNPKRIQLCLANFTDKGCPPEACTICGITVKADSGFSFLTTFKEGLGSSLSSMVSVFGKDRSVYSVKKYNDGSSVLQYRFSNGLTEGQTISVLAEADQKSLAELMTAETGQDGKTIETLSLYYFKIPK